MTMEYIYLNLYTDSITKLSLHKFLSGQMGARFEDQIAEIFDISSAVNTSAKTIRVICILFV